MKERDIQPGKIERVVVRGANWVGDAVMTVPALKGLRRVLPGARVTLATRAWAEGIFAGAEFVDELLLIDGSARGLRSVWRQARAWREKRFDLALLLPNAFEPALVASLARVPRRVGYATDGRGFLLSNPLPVPEWRAHRHEVFYYLNVVAELEKMLKGSSDLETYEPQPSLRVADERRREARESLRARGVGLIRPLVALCPGSTNSRAKRWPAERFAALADRLMTDAGADVLLVGSPEESEVSETVAARMSRKPFVLTGETSLAETVALLSVADLLVTNDTGPAHVAAAVGCPVVVIFGPTNPLTTRPFSLSAEVVREPPACAPCMLRECPIDHRCMTAINADEVFARAARVLKKRTKLEAVR
ncbi:MAG TPA: lipopolysaccharide heptosyltransferase II [Pyrinomonadaceae bacterium]|nr:lipopolysaccharide heptosyltransferase II [Pyrinomonadaceae bacterium]